METLGAFEHAAATRAVDAGDQLLAHFEMLHEVVSLREGAILGTQPW